MPVVHSGHHQVHPCSFSVLPKHYSRDFHQLPKHYHIQSCTHPRFFDELVLQPEIAARLVQVRAFLFNAYRGHVGNRGPTPARGSLTAKLRGRVHGVFHLSKQRFPMCPLLCLLW